MPIQTTYTIERSVDVEDSLREILRQITNAYCRPLPANASLPCVLVQSVGGSSDYNYLGRGKVDTFTVALDSRAKSEDEALETLRDCIGFLEVYISQHNTGIANIAVNSLYSWGNDPVRPDLAMCSATLLVTAHRETATVEITL